MRIQRNAHQDVLDAIRWFEAGAESPYGESTGYDLLIDGRRYPPKAIVGFAARRVTGGRLLDPVSQFSGGEGSSAANAVLRRLGFTVVPKASLAPRSTVPSGGRGDWTTTEIGIIVPAYLDLLHAELDGDVGEAPGRARPPGTLAGTGPAGPWS